MTILMFHCCYVFFSGGKRDEKLILPFNDSISAALDTEQASDVIAYLRGELKLTFE